jgi:hypothetical protein
MHQNPYFLEKSMEEHSRSMEMESRKWWRYRKEKDSEEQASASPSLASSPARSNPDHETTATCQTYTTRHA